MYEIQPNLDLYGFKRSKVETLIVDSPSLINNPLRDPTRRINPLLVPSSPKTDLPVVFVLAGFSGNGTKYFAPKMFEENAVQILGKAIDQRQAPDAIYVFVDAFTYWGGSQFINSDGMGAYEDYIVKDLVNAVKKSYSVALDPGKWCVSGGSSGGYGALSLASRHPDKFGLCATIAPDSFFEMSLLPEIYKAKPIIEKLGGVRGVRSEIDSGRFFRRKDSHLILNVIAMGLCYACCGNDKIEWPIDREGNLIKDVWKKWLAHDPIQFLAKRKKKIEQLKRVYIDVGQRDQFHLQYGARQIQSLFRPLKTQLDYNEFDGTHFDISEQRVPLWIWLKKQFT